MPAPARAALFAALVVSSAACAVTIPDWKPDPVAAKAGQEGNPCAPGAGRSLVDDPLSQCAVAETPLVPDLASDDVAENAGAGARTASVRPLDNAQNAAAPKPKSCTGNGPGIDTCGPNGNGSCCAIAKVPAGRAGKVKVGDFDLGVYEVTSGRFAKFVEATGGNLRAAARNGGWPKWKDKWTPKLASSRAELDYELGPGCKRRSNVRDYGARTWPSADIEAAVDEIIVDQNPRAADIRADARPARLHQKPINCVTYWTAAAFCAWDGGRLPTVDEWVYAAVGGDELREYPWGKGLGKNRLVTDLSENAADNEFTWPEDFPFNGNGLNAYHIAPPGRKPAGVGRWGHHDLGGNVLEWMADTINDEFGRVRGGSWEGHPAKNTFEHYNYPLAETYGAIGFRCAYGEQGPKPKKGAGALGEEGAEGDEETAGVVRGFAANAGDYLLGVTQGEGAPNYVSEGVAFRVLTEAPAEGVALHRCQRANGKHFLSNDAACEGQTVEGPIGFAYADEQPGTLPLYRCFGNDRHLSTVTPDECGRLGLAVEGTQGFVVAPPPSTYLRSLYQAALGRDVDAMGHVGWLTAFRRDGCSAASLGAVFAGVMLSPELAARKLTPDALVDALYRGGLSRAPDPAGAANAKAQLAGGTPLSALVDSVKSSPEFAGLAAARCAN